tara:strand:- start:62592 stop:63152 length:561 start_codon:yes stop_codon:yes gene_type:complete
MKNQNKSKKTIIITIIAVFLMFGFGFALVPIYDVFCDLTGLNGKTSNEISTEVSSVDKSRTITVEFVSTLNDGMPWIFKPNVFKVKLHPGEMKRVSFYAKNLSNKTITGQAIPSVSPGNAAKYLRKTECFCFNQQVLKPGEEIDMPIIFHVDRDLPKDINTITLSYTMFDAGAFPRADIERQGKIT